MRRSVRANRPDVALDSFEGAVAVVTGGAGGIGSGVVRALRARGAAVVVLDLRHSADATLSMLCDVTDPDSVEFAITHARAELGVASLLVCSAGVVSEHPLDQLAAAEWHRVVDVSLTSAYLVSKSVVPAMAEAGGGAVVTMSSGWARKGYPFGPHYAAAKSGVEALTKSLALEFASKGVRANSIAPGPIRTAMIDDNSAFDAAAKVDAIPMGRLGDVEDVVLPTLFLLGKDSRYVTGQVLHVNGGLLMP